MLIVDSISLQIAHSSEYSCLFGTCGWPAKNHQEAIRWLFSLGCIPIAMFKRMNMGGSLTGRSGKSYRGVDCIADQNTKLYSTYSSLLQNEVAWVDQPKYGKYTVYFGVVVIFLATVKHVWYLVNDRRYRKNPASLSVFASFMDLLVSYSRFFGYKQLPQTLCRAVGLPPSTGAFLVMSASTIYMLCYCLIPHFWYRACRGFGSPPLAVRAGVMATALTPFVYVLSGKCNMITLLTGVSYEKLNSMHQFVGLAAFVLSVIHTIPFIWQDLAEIGASGLRGKFTHEFYYKSGIPPLILLGLLCTLSNRHIRSMCYEVFVYSHWAFGIAYFGTLIWHINKLLNLQDYMWGALAFWATQILYRIFLKTAFKPNALFLRPRAAKLTRSGPNAFLVSVDGTAIKCEPGQHCYLRFCGSRMLDNHPFSVATVPDGDSPDLKFVIVPKKGFTKKLQMELNENITTNKKVFVDGPYGGSSRDCTAFDKVILLATGSGVSATLPFLVKLSNHIFEAKENNTPIVTQKVRFVWIARYKQDVDWFRDEIDRCIARAAGHLDVIIYVAESGLVEGETSSSKEPDVKTDEKSLDMDIIYRKPQMKEVLRSATEQLGRRNMIVSSGSSSMKADVRNVSAKLQARVFNADSNHQGVEEVYLHTETFGW